MTDRLTCDEVRELAAAHVLGAVEPEDADAVREHLATCDRAHDEFAELGSVVPALALAVETREPAPELKARILAAAAADPLASTPPLAAGGVAPALPQPFAPIDGRTSDVVQSRTNRGTPALGWAMRVAAVLAIVTLVGWNLLLQGRLDASETHARDVAAVLEAASRPGALAAVMAPAEDGGPRGIAAVGPDGSVTIALRDLAPTSGDEVYEAWVIAGDGAPVPVGGFRVGDGGTGRLDGSGPSVPSGSVVALTREPAPGAVTPTLPIVSIGTALSSGAS